MESTVRDLFQRPLRSLRLSVTDRCNLRCSYCMPEEDYSWLQRKEILTFEEILRLVDVFLGLGVRKLRLTGGEPLLRQDLDRLIRELARRPLVSDLALTTNGVLLGDFAGNLKTAGLHRLTVSLDTLSRDTFQRLTRRDDLERVLSGLEAAERSGFQGIKIDTVVVRGTNDHEVLPLLSWARERNFEIRFIEYMDVGGATGWSPEKVVSRQEILRTIGHGGGSIEPLPNLDSAPADRFRLSSGQVFGVISSTTEPFCRTCDRSRLVADGRWFQCLYARDGIDLRKLLRSGASDDDLREEIRARWLGRSDRGAEERLGVQSRGPLVARKDLVSDPHLEMHKRGG